MQQAGFCDTNPIRINEVDITPLEFTSRLLVNQWKLEAGEEEFTVMKINIRGEEKTITYDLLDRYDQKKQVSSMGRTTGYTCAAAVNLIADNLFIEKGIFPPELVGKNEQCFNYVISYLEKRGVTLLQQQLP